MKKVFGIIILVVVIIATACYVNAKAELTDGIVYGIDYDEAEIIMKKYAEIKGYDDWLTFNHIDGVLYGYGVLCTEDFHDRYDVDWSIENFISKSTENFDCEMHIDEIDNVGDVAFYRLQAQSETKQLEYYDGEYYYCVDEIFMVFSRNEV